MTLFWSVCASFWPVCELGPFSYFYVALTLILLLLSGIVVAVKGVDRSGDLPLLGGAAMAAAAAFILTLLTLSHFRPE